MDELPTEGWMVTKVLEDISEVWVAFKRDPSDQRLRNALIERYLPLVRYNADRVWSKLPDGVDLNDLISAGVFGLIDAIEAFDMERGVKFETYCVPRIRGVKPARWKRPARNAKRKWVDRRPIRKSRPRCSSRSKNSNG
jgi:RNA polymerase sigma factor (sigma-70 family)